VNDEQTLIRVDNINYLEEPISDASSDHLPFSITDPSRIGSTGTANILFSFLD